MIEIGFDIGGTNIKAGIVDESLKVLAGISKPFPKGEKYDQVILLMRSMVGIMLDTIHMKYEEVASIGVAVPGSLDAKGEEVINAFNLGFYHVPLKKAMEDEFPGVKIFLSNDANAAALGELKKGAFLGCKTAVLITLGTGVGGGLILGGKLFNGGMGHGVELGHVRLVHNGPLCTCGNHGCIETVCSAAFFKNQGLEAKETLDLAKGGDEKAIAVFNQYIDYLSDALVSIALLLDPEVIAIGGGISLAGDFLFIPLRKLVEEKSFFKFPYKIVPAQLGNKAGFIGAAMLRRENS